MTLWLLETGQSQTFHRDAFLLQAALSRPAPGFLRCPLRSDSGPPAAGPRKLSPPSAREPAAAGAGPWCPAEPSGPGPTRQPVNSSHPTSDQQRGALAGAQGREREGAAFLVLGRAGHLPGLLVPRRGHREGVCYYPTAHGLRGKPLGGWCPASLVPVDLQFRLSPLPLKIFAILHGPASPS